MSALERWQDTVTQNISSSQMPGYRKRTTAFSATEAGQIQLGASQDTAQNTVFPKATGAINFLPGEAQATGRDLDVSIQGDGFFIVQGPGGGIATAVQISNQAVVPQIDVLQHGTIIANISTSTISRPWEA